MMNAYCDKSMKILNFSNVEELIFYDRQAQNALPIHMFSLFEQWRLAQRIPALKQLGRQALLDFLNGLTGDDLVALEKHFDEKIIVEKLNYSIVHNLTIPLNDSSLCEALCEIEGFGYFSTWRDADFLYISFWR
jgi:hypothetical protein